MEGFTIPKLNSCGGVTGHLKNTYVITYCFRNFDIKVSVGTYVEVQQSSMTS